MWESKEHRQHPGPVQGSVFPQDLECSRKAYAGRLWSQGSQPGKTQRPFLGNVLAPTPLCRDDAERCMFCLEKVSRELLGVAQVLDL